MKARLLLAFVFVFSQALVLTGGVTAQGSEPPAQAPTQRAPTGNRINQSSAPSTVPLGQSGMSFRYVQTFGITDQAYQADVQHLNRPNGMFIDGTDNVYVVEERGSRMLKYNSAGANTLTIGTAGLSYVDHTVFSLPKDVAVDAGGNIWVLDENRVTEFSSSGTYLQVFPDWPQQPWSTGSDNQHFNIPRGIAFDSAGRLYVSDQNNDRVQVYQIVSNTISYSTTIGVTGVTGSDSSHFNQPAQITIDGSDRLYVSDLLNYRVQRCTYSAGWSCTTFHGTGSAGNGINELNFAYGLGRDTSNNVYIADSANGRVKKCTSGGSCSVLAAGLLWPAGVAADSIGNVYVNDFNDFTVKKFNSSGTPLGTFAGTSGAPYSVDTVRFYHPWGVAAGADGSLYVVESTGARLIKLNAAGGQQWTFGQAGVVGSDNAHLGAFWAGPAIPAVDDAMGRVYVADTGNHRVQIISTAGAYVGTLGVTGSSGTDNAHFNCPYAVHVNPANGDLYVADTCNHRVQVFSKNLVYKATLGVPGVSGSDNIHFNSPWDVAVDATGNIFVADSGNDRVQKCILNGSSGTCSTFVGETGVFNADFGHLHPAAVAADSAGRVYVTDIYNNRIQLFDVSGAYLTTLGGAWGPNSGQMRSPAGVALDSAGNVFVADWINNRVQKFSPGVPGWRQSNLNGFGDPRYGINALTVFGNQMYAGGWTTTNQMGPVGASIWRTPDGHAWNQVNTTGLEDPNISVDNLFVFSNTLFLGTENLVNGANIYTSTDGVAWTNVITTGFGITNNVDIVNMAAYNGSLYAGVLNYATGVQIWRTADGASWSPFNLASPQKSFWWTFAQFGGRLYAGAGDGTTGLLYRTDGITWTAVTTNGFGDSNNGAIPSLAAFNGYLYAGTRNIPGGAQVWRSSSGDPGSWTKVVTGGLGDSANGRGYGLIKTGTALYYVITNLATGDQVWKTEDGTNWSQVGFGGWGNSNNQFSDYWNIDATIFNGGLYIGTQNNTGGEVWELLNTLYLPLVRR